MKIKTAELTGAALDWAVAKCEGSWVLSLDSFVPHRRLGRMNFSTDWAQGGPIIDREGISVLDANGCWAGRKTYWDNSKSSCETYGPTPLIAAMRCLVASKLGDEVEVPDELR